MIATMREPWAMTRRFDREFAAGYAALAVATVIVARLAVTDVWANWASALLKL
jgi:hypothetical protein